MYQDVLEIDLRNINWKFELWKDFLKEIRREYRRIEEVNMGILKIYYKNARITEFQIVRDMFRMAVIR